MNNNRTILILGIIYVISFSLRFFGLTGNHPFWVDEFATANQARLILRDGLSYFFNQESFIEPHNFTTYSLVALFFKIFGEYEWVARLPTVIFGSFVPVIVFLLSKAQFNFPVALSASILTVFSYFEITWSRQARGYMLVQLLILLTVYVYLQIVKSAKAKAAISTYFMFGLFIILGLLTHSFFFLLLTAIFFHFILFQRNKAFKIIKNPVVFVLSSATFFLFYLLGFFTTLYQSILQGGIGIYNNIWYYHSFLWREYGLITFLGLFGLIIGLTKRKKEISLILIYIVLHLIFVNFFYGHYISKYLLPIFPFLFIGTAYTIYILSLSLAGIFPIGLITFFLTLFIVLNGYKFVFKPKTFYSVNHDFREIALIDYHKIYQMIKSKGDIRNSHPAVIETWPARVYWYLGPDYQPIYIFRWKNEKLFISGQRIQRTPFFKNDQGEKIVPKSSNLKLIEDASDLKKAVKQYPRGFILIDDTSLPIDVREYAEKNLKKEIYLEHYPLDENPYSIWPATLYSWGI